MQNAIINLAHWYFYAPGDASSCLILTALWQNASSYAALVQSPLMISPDQLRCLAHRLVRTRKALPSSHQITKQRKYIVHKLNLWRTILLRKSGTSIPRDSQCPCHCSYPLSFPLFLCFLLALCYCQLL